MNSINPNKIRWVIAIAAALFFIPFLGNVHLFDWDEINFAESAREMIVTGDYLTVRINYLPFWEKPPLFIWIQVLSMKIFGVNEFAARFPNAIAGIATLLVLFNIGRRMHSNRFGIIWVMAYAGSILPFFYFKSGIIDPWFNLFIFLGMYYLMFYAYPENRKKMVSIILSAVFSGLAILTKGPVGFLLVALTCCIYLLIIRFRMKVRFSEVIVFVVILSLVGGFWFILQILDGKFETVLEFMIYQLRLFQTKDAGHGGFFGYHFVILLFGLFPTSVIALKSFGKDKHGTPVYRLMKQWMLILFWVVMILFTIVQTKIIHYSSMAYFPVSFLAAHFIERAYNNELQWSRWQSVLLSILALLISIPAMGLQFVDRYKDELIAQGWIKDEFTAGLLTANANWSGFELLPGLFFLLSVLLILILIKRESVLKRVVLLWSVTLFFTFSLMILIVPRIEKYSQNALVEFFESKQGKDVYLKNIYFKSYATYFYGEISPPENENYYDESWLLNGEIDKDAYFVTKIHRANRLKNYTELERIGEKNGFVFFLRKAKKQ